MSWSEKASPSVTDPCEWPTPPLRLQVLGPLRVWRGDVEVNPGAHQQALLLAILLAQHGRPVSTSHLIEALWGAEPPTSALNVIRKYVGGLRRILQPELAAREEGLFIRRRGTRYLFTADAQIVDVAAFQADLALGKAASRALSPDAIDHFERALGRWTGAAGAGTGVHHAASAVFSALDAQFVEACILAAGEAARFGCPDRVLSALHLASTMAPFDEPLHANLMMTLAATGRRAEALSVYHSLQSRLSDELGLDPSMLVRRTHDRILLAQDEGTVAPSIRAVPVSAEPTDAPAGGNEENFEKDPAGIQTEYGRTMVGRARERETLREVVRNGLRGGRRVALVEGEAGAGKTLLLDVTGRDSEAAGARVIWGHCRPGGDVPPLWPWVELTRGLVDSRSDASPTPQMREFLSRDGSAFAKKHDRETADRSRLIAETIALVEGAARERPLVLVLEDLQWADSASFELLEALLRELPRGVTVLCSLRTRPRQYGAELVRTLVSMGRTMGFRRIELFPLSYPEVDELVSLVAGRQLDVRAVDDIHTRSGGNAFFVGEIARLVAERGPGDSRGRVPAAVQEITREKAQSIDSDARELLQLAALIGRDVDLGVLAHSADVAVERCLIMLEPVLALGVLEPIDDDPYCYRFAHEVVREAVSESTPRRLAQSLHLRIADSLQRLAPGTDSTVERIAHHLWAAGPLADPQRTAEALRSAGNSAVEGSALEAADRHFFIAGSRARAVNASEQPVIS